MKQKSTIRAYSNSIAPTQFSLSKCKVILFVAVLLLRTYNCLFIYNKFAHWFDKFSSLEAPGRVSLSISISSAFHVICSNQKDTYVGYLLEAFLP